MENPGQTPRSSTTSVPSNGGVPGQIPHRTTSPRQETEEDRAARLRQRQQEELRRSEELLRPVINVDPDHSVSRCN